MKNFNVKPVFNGAISVSILLSLVMNLAVAASKNDSPNSHENEAEHAQEVELTSQQIDLAGIKSQKIISQKMSTLLLAPGEVKANGYNSYYLSPRVESVVIKRYVTLGEMVEKGQQLVRLFSEDVAQAQADYRLAHADWFRVKNLTSATMSDKQKLAAQTLHITTSSKLKVYGLSAQDIKEIIDNVDLALGEYTLTAERDGAVLSDEFHQGQRIDAGKSIMVITDESQLWVEARLPATTDVELPINTTANITTENSLFVGQVIQEGHTIDPITRTRIVRLGVENKQHQLHQGMFVDVSFAIESNEPVVAVPQSALMRSSDGDWQVFIEEKPGEYNALEVEVGQILHQKNDVSLTQWQEVTGLAEGLNVVTSGAFFIASQAAKSGFDVHNH